VSTQTQPEARALPGAVEVAVAHWQTGKVGRAREYVAEEVPVALIFNGISHAVMMATPADLEDFAIGFSLSEDIIRERGELYGIEVEESELGIELRIDIAAECFSRLKERRRTLTGRTGCGLCGTESLAQFARHPAQVSGAGRIDASALHRAVTELRQRQPVHEATGATHAAGWARADGSIQYVREDVGRHNALDKLIGALAQNHAKTGDGFVVLTSRASYEMVLKSAMVGIPIVVAVSAPTHLAIELAQEAGITLAGFAREGRHTVYSHPQRMA
jgi:FdhD protein